MRKKYFYPFAIAGSLLLTGCMQQLPVRQIGQQGQPVFIPAEQREQAPVSTQPAPVVTQQPQRQPAPAAAPAQTQRVSSPTPRPSTTQTRAPARQTSAVRDEPLLRTVEEVEVNSAPVRIRVH